jgi:geranylgeranyl reductase family protein
MYDVIVAGAGPSGAYCAYLLAEAGLHVVLAEKERVPRRKPCAGGLTPKVERLLDFPIDDVIQRRCLTVVYSLRSVEGHRAELRETGITTVDRAEFDHFLVRKAVGKGAEVRAGTEVTAVQEERDRVTVSMGSRRLAGRFLVAADGARSGIARSLGIHPRQRCCVAVNAEADLDTAWEKNGWVAGPEDVCFELGTVPGGYAWCFPRNGCASIGIFTTRQRLPRMRRRLHDFAARAGFTGRRSPRHLQGHPVPVGGAPDVFHSERTVLVGDAASAVDPFTGEGIAHALRTARIAAGAVRGALANGGSHALEVHTRQVNDVVHRELRWARCAAFLFYTVPIVSYRFGANTDQFSEMFGRVVAGRCSYRKLLLPFI